MTDYGDLIRKNAAEVAAKRQAANEEDQRKRASMLVASQEALRWLAQVLEPEIERANASLKSESAFFELGRPQSYGPGYQRSLLFHRQAHRSHPYTVGVGGGLFKFTQQIHPAGQKPIDNMHTKVNDFGEMAVGRDDDKLPQVLTAIIKENLPRA